MKSLIIVILASALVFTAGQTIDECLKQDSISCVQKALYKSAKELFGKDNLELLSGVNLVKSGAGARGSRSGKQLVYDQEMDTATNIVERQRTLENFIGDQTGQFLTGRSLRINFVPAFERISESARAISESAPQEIRQAVDEVVEGRGKKKMMKSIMPLLLAAKLKIGVMMTLAYFFIGMLAKKAIFASLISLAISAFVGLKALWSSKGKHDVTSYNSAWVAPVSTGAWVAPASGGWVGPVSSGGWTGPVSSGGWNGGASSSGWEDPHAYAHGQAYSGYHH